MEVNLHIPAMVDKKRENAIMLCRDCFYDLRGCHSGQCPECGRKYCLDDPESYAHCHSMKSHVLIFVVFLSLIIGVIIFIFLYTLLWGLFSLAYNGNSFFWFESVRDGRVWGLSYISKSIFYLCIFVIFSLSVWISGLIIRKAIKSRHGHLIRS